MHPLSNRFRLQINQVSVGDVVLLKNPLDSDKFLVRRLAALGGYEMASTDEKDEPFVLDDYHCWVLSDNKKLKIEVCSDLLKHNIFTDWLMNRASMVLAEVAILSYPAQKRYPLRK